MNRRPQPLRGRNIIKTLVEVAEWMVGKATNAMTVCLCAGAQRLDSRADTHGYIILFGSQF